MKGKKTKIDEIELLFRALADRTRLRLLNLISDDEVCVCFLVEALNLTQPKISRHLAYLRRAGIVGARREGKWMHYRVVVPTEGFKAGVLVAVRQWLSNHPEMALDRGRLAKLCCGGSLPGPLKNAPKPLSFVST
ncbi:MAG TPA: metalloregulator ArsR/SmtB family transcription factor [Candidatus Binatia bacterium]|nr:metalloregulator ArsR/SmtB family transcription factor [Candidatus Binatia bacterium]